MLIFVMKFREILTNASADRPFEGYGEKLLGFDGEFHRQFVHDLLGIAVDDESNGLFGRYSALIACLNFAL